MHPVVFIYSPNEIRGKIISETLKVRGIGTHLLTSHFEVEEAIRAYSPPIIILDIKKDLSTETDFLHVISQWKPEAQIIILADRPDPSVLETPDIGNTRCIPGPLAPEVILSEVKSILFPEKKISIAKFCHTLLSTGLFQLKRFFFWSLPLTLTLIVGLIGGYVYWCIATLPRIETLHSYSPYESSKIYSYDNVLLSEFYIERRNIISPDRLPQHVKNAFIAVEDARFYKHAGIDPIRMFSAFLVNMKEGGFVQGGSTITQQLAKMLFFKPEKTITRKVKEIAISLQMEKRYTKDEILGLYLNNVYFGTRAYGIDAASHIYFGKASENITISEAALLAALPKAPSKYSPFTDPKKSLSRRNYVLKRMLQTRLITKEEYQRSLGDSIPEEIYARRYKAPYYVDHCRGILEKMVGDRLYTSGLKIYTTLDYRMQQIAEKAVSDGIDKLKKRGITGVQAALLAIDIKTGRIKAMVGGTNFWDSQFNRVTQAKRQPGSTFKPIVYLTALDQGLKPSDMIEDKKINYHVNGQAGSWTPLNYSKKYHGAVTLNTALALSFNAATVNLARKVGIQNMIRTAHRVGIKSTIHPFYSSAIGASELTLLELVSTYATLAGGKRIEPTCINRIIDREQATLVEPSIVRETVVGKKTLAGIRGMLRSVVLEGTGRGARVLKRAVYGKTGTTNDSVDAWFIGFDENIALGVWIGRDDHTSIGGDENGATAALPIWVDFMRGSGTVSEPAEITAYPAVTMKEREVRVN
ncbi:MAG: PBP1A family penicillin-binding protein [Deltaproteobacteria bacterium]|nr:PBP1A family penicillin-binding protein [Deltaproteobacteria bacterium]